jgi:hypothetical protein
MCYYRIAGIGVVDFFKNLFGQFGKFSNFYTNSQTMGVMEELTSITPCLVTMLGFYSIDIKLLWKLLYSWLTLLKLVVMYIM